MISFYMVYGSIEECWAYGGYEMLIEGNSWFSKNERDIILMFKQLFTHKENFNDFKVIIWDENSSVEDLTKALFADDDDGLVHDLTTIPRFTLDYFKRQAMMAIEQERVILEQKKQEEKTKAIAESTQREKEQLKKLLGKYRDIGYE